jgi:hypothetical protein
MMAKLLFLVFVLTYTSILLHGNIGIQKRLLLPGIATAFKK